MMLDDAAMFDINFDVGKRRLHLRYSGYWTVAEAKSVHRKFAQVLDKASKAGSFTLLDDLTEFAVQSPEVVDANQDFVTLLERAPVIRNAMVVPSALVRRQVKRQLAFDDQKFMLFEDYASADHWLAEVEPAGS